MAERVNDKRDYDRDCLDHYYQLDTKVTVLETKMEQIEENEESLLKHVNKNEEKIDHTTARVDELDTTIDTAIKVISRVGTAIAGIIAALYAMGGKSLIHIIQSIMG